MDFKHFQYVLKVAELQNMTKAANELYITQPSLSHYIARVEEEVGVQLFNRNTTPISLTLAGEKYVETAKMILSLNDRLKHELSDISAEKKGRVTVGISHARASFFLPYVLPQFQRQFPGVEVRTVEVRSDLIEEYVSKGKCDIGILPFPVSASYDLEQEVICNEELLLVSGRPLKEEQHLDGKTYIDLRRCGDDPFVLLKRGHGIRTAVDILFLEHGIRPPQIFETTSNETAYRLSSAGMGLSIVPESTMMLSHAVSTPYCYSMGADGFRWQIGAVYRQKEYLSAAQKAFVALLKICFGEEDSLLGMLEKERVGG